MLRDITRASIVAAVAAFLLGHCTHIRASEIVKQTDIDLSSVHVSVVWVESQTELRDAARKLGVYVRSDALHGFSVLGKRDGRDACIIYVFRPRIVDDDRTLTLGHEMLHCLVGNYHD